MSRPSLPSEEQDIFDMFIRMEALSPQIAAPKGQPTSTTQYVNAQLESQIYILVIRHRSPRFLLLRAAVTPIVFSH